jgi:hypothetical protein
LGFIQDDARVREADRLGKNLHDLAPELASVAQAIVVAVRDRLVSPQQV